MCKANKYKVRSWKVCIGLGQANESIVNCYVIPLEYRRHIMTLLGSSDISDACIWQMSANPHFDMNYLMLLKYVVYYFYILPNIRTYSSHRKI